jgi:hypothetical protein
VIGTGIIARKSAIARKTRKIGEQSKKDDVVRPVIGRQLKMLR